MLLSCRRLMIAAVIAGPALAVTTVNAQQPKAPPAGATGWTAVSTPQGGGEMQLDAKQTAAVQRVSTYFAELKQMRGVFVQTDPDKKRTRGRFYVQKPGKFRFDYAAPSRKIMASDGRMLRIKEPDQANPDTIELDNTPFRLLLKQNVDLVRDARILEVQESEDLVIVTLQDRSPDAPGRVTLIFVAKPAFELKEWVVRDPQGLETRVEIGDINKTDPVDPALFRWEQSSPFEQK